MPIHPVKQSLFSLTKSWFKSQDILSEEFLKYSFQRAPNMHKYTASLIHLPTQEEFFLSYQVVNSEPIINNLNIYIYSENSKKVDLFNAILDFTNHAKNNGFPYINMAESVFDKQPMLFAGFLKKEGFQKFPNGYYVLKK